MNLEIKDEFKPVSFCPESVFSTPILFAAAKLVEIDENVESLKRNDNSYSLSDTLNYYNVKKH